ncbi:hypothetical protein SGF_01858 [Shigella flexneri CDC 796-83]|uniref:Uncharacterized protein n=1 Tax=Shigella flexneri CDC 796-83 TaxID=945360 RepID=A0A6N3QKP8_SHIFL|nr:hypothetical protein SGF_01858 [Shigella flexneri CDC 796-83]
MHAGTVQNQYRLLFFCFYGDFFTRLLNRHPDSPGIHHIILIAHDECLNEAGLQQPDFMTKFCQFPCPVLRTSTGLHTNQAWLTVAEERQKILSTQLFINHFICVLIDEVNLNDMFCDINANRCIFHLWSFQSEGALCIPYWAL